MKFSRIEPIPKHVEIVLLSDGCFATKPGIDLSRFLDNILDIRARIEAGTELRSTIIAKVRAATICSKRADGCICTSATASMTTYF